MSDYPDTPITREEQYLAAGLDGGDLPDPITREERYLYEIATKMQGGGSSVTVEPLTVTENGTTTAPSGKAYSPVTTNVPNSYGASDEGKVVSNGALVAQTAHAPVTANGTIDTTLYNSVPVNVPNPNYVETISGTVGSPFGNYTIVEIAELVRSDNATIRMDLQGDEFAGQLLGNYLNFVKSTPAGDYPQTPWKMESISYALPDGSLFGWVVAENDRGDNVFGIFQREYPNNVASGMSCTLTIIHHPLPDSE